MTHKLQNNYNKEILTLLRKLQDPQQISQPGDLSKELAYGVTKGTGKGSLRIPREFDFGGQWNLIIELTQDWANRLLEGTNKTSCTPRPRSTSAVSDSSQPLQPTKLLCPWDSSGKNTGVGCHFLLQGIFPTQGSNLHLMSPALAGGFFITNAT